MANELLHADGFVRYNGDENLLALEYDLSTGCVLDNTKSHSGGWSLAIGGLFGTHRGIRKTLRDTHTKLLIGTYLFIDTPVTLSAKGIWVYNNSGQRMCGVVLNPDNSLTVWDLNNNDKGTTRSLISPGVFHPLEIAFRYAPGSAGSIEVRAHGNEVGDVIATGVNMGASPISMWGIGQDDGAQTAGCWIGGVYVKDGDEFMGQVVLYESKPDSDGSDADWSRNGAASTFDCINDTTVDNDSTYIEATDVGDRSSVGFPNAPSDISSIEGVLFYALAKSSDPGDATLAMDCNTGGTIGEGEDFTLFSGYKYFDQGFHLDPDTGEKFEPGDYNTMLAEYVKNG